MNSEITINSANDFAKDYDDYIQKRNWYGSEIIFGLMFYYLKKNQTLLDIGIGTGLSSSIFKQFGFLITGIDGSIEMLNICKNKNIANELKLIDLTQNTKWFDTDSFDNAISHGVFHLIGDLSNIFNQTSLTLKQNGIFAFTIQEYNSTSYKEFKETQIKGLFARPNQQSGILVYCHTNFYIMEQLNKYGFTLLKKTEFLAYVNEQTKTFFTVYISGKK